MPELPEVETVRRVLEEHLKGRAITSYELGRPTFYRKPPKSAFDGFVGAVVQAVRRRGKYLTLQLSGGKALTMHLGMSGRIVLGGDGPHKRFSFIAEGLVVNFYDARRFGRVACPLPDFGPEPLEPDFTADYLYAAVKPRRAPIKALLMDQAVVAGLGNIYATEALFEAAIRPGRTGASLTRADVERLTGVIKKVLARAVASGGSTLEDSAYLDPLGRPGGFQNEVSVYGRKTGRCGHALKTTRKPIAGRTSVFCPSCQR